MIFMMGVFTWECLVSKGSPACISPCLQQEVNLTTLCRFPRTVAVLALVFVLGLMVVALPKTNALEGSEHNPFAGVLPCRVGLDGATLLPIKRGRGARSHRRFTGPSQRPHQLATCVDTTPGKPPSLPSYPPVTRPTR